MNILHLGTYGLGICMLIYGLVGLATGWQDGAAAIALIMSGLAALGVTHQNVKLAGAIKNSY